MDCKLGRLKHWVACIYQNIERRLKIVLSFDQWIKLAISLILWKDNDKLMNALFIQKS